MKFTYQKLEDNSPIVEALKESSSGVAIKIEKYEALKELESFDDGFYLVEGTEQTFEKEGNELYVTLLDEASSFVIELGIEFY